MKIFIIFLLSMCASSTLFTKEKIIFDTDTAYFNDDGAALTMLIQSHKVDILGITIVAGNTWTFQGQQYMLRLLEILNRTDIPTFIGAQRPLIQNENLIQRLGKTVKFGWKGAFKVKLPIKLDELILPYGGKLPKIQPQEKNAIDFIIETIEKHPNEISILALGPLTNIAIALRLQPSIEKKIKSIIIMGGTFKEPGTATEKAEFNLWFDPEAAKIVLQSDIKKKVIFPLDLTNQAPLTKKRFDNVAAIKTPITDIYKHDYVAEKFAKNPESISYVWDCIPAAYLLNSSIITKNQDFYLDVATSYDTDYGRLIMSERKIGSPTLVMQKLNIEKFFSIYTNLLTRPVY